MGRASFGIFAILLLGAVIVAANTMFMVNQWQQALVLEFGAPGATYNVGDEAKPGLKFKVPLRDSVVYLDKRNLELDSEPAEITALGNQRLIVDTFARWRIVEPRLFYERLGSERQAVSRLKQLLNTSVREELGKVGTTEIISGQRAELMGRIQNNFAAAVETSNFGIEIIDVKIRKVELPSQNRRQVFARMIAERNQEAQGIRAEGREESVKIRADADRQVRILKAEATEEAQKIRGQGDSQRNKTYADAYNLDAEFFAFYRSMLAYEAAIETGTTMVLSPDSDFFTYFGDENGGR